jgi:hypothetical protein
MPRFFSRNYNSSLKFNGSSNYVTLGASGSIAQSSAAFSVACWVKLNTSSAGKIFTPVGDTTGSLNRFYFQISDNKITSYVKTDGTSASLGGSAVIPLNVWAHLVMTYDGANVRAYINGALDQTVVCTGACSASVSGMAIGRGFAGMRYHNGNIARVQYWNARALSLTEIQEIYFNGADESSASIRSGMTGEWKLDEATGSTAIDTFGNNNGTITGATYDSDTPFKSEFIQRNANASVLVNGVDGAAGNALSIANNASLSPTAAVTLELWFRPITQRAMILFDNSTSGTTNSYFLSMGADGNLSWFSTIGGIAKNIVGTVTKAKFNEWNMVSATYDGSAIRFFLNGSQLAETLAATGSLGTNSGPLRIGAYYSGGISATFHGSLSSPRVYAAGCTLAEHQDRYYRGITSAALQAALVLDLNTERGASSTSNDLSGLGNNATLGASASWTSDSPFKARKLINGNMVKNGDFEYAPPFTAATTGSAVWLDGTVAGSATNDLFSWYKINGAGTYAASFDSTTKFAGNYSIKMEETDATGRGRLLTAPFETNTTAALIAQYGIPASPSTDYDVSAYIKTNLANASSVRIIVLFYTSAGTQSGSYTGAFQASTQDFTLFSGRFTTASTTNYVVIRLDDNTASGAAHQVWFDSVSLTPVYPEGRVPANGNLVKNFDFEVAPTFVAATNTTQRFIDGTAAGSSTNGTYKWAIVAVSTAGTFSAQFDSSVSFAGQYSMKLSIGATGSALNVGSLTLVSAANLANFGIPVIPNTSYTATYRMRTVLTSGSATTGARMNFNEYDSAAGNSVSNQGTAVLTTTDWTLYTVTFTTAATTNYIVPRLVLRGNDGAATLIMDAWFDDIYLAKTTNPGRVVIT